MKLNYLQDLWRASWFRWLRAPQQCLDGAPSRPCVVQCAYAVVLFNFVTVRVTQIEISSVTWRDSGIECKRIFFSEHHLQYKKSGSKNKWNLRSLSRLSSFLYRSIVSQSCTCPVSGKRPRNVAHSVRTVRQKHYEALWVIKLRIILYITAIYFQLWNDHGNHETYEVGRLWSRAVGEKTANNFAMTMKACHVQRSNTVLNDQHRYVRLVP